MAIDGTRAVGVDDDVGGRRRDLWGRWKSTGKFGSTDMVRLALLAGGGAAESGAALLDRREPPIFRFLSDLRCAPIDEAQAVELFAATGSLHIAGAASELAVGWNSVYHDRCPYARARLTCWSRLVGAAAAGRRRHFYKETAIGIGVSSAAKPRSAKRLSKRFVCCCFERRLK